MSLQAIEPELVVATAGSGGSGGGFAATLSADDVAVNRFLLDLIRCVPVCLCACVHVEGAYLVWVQVGPLGTHTRPRCFPDPPSLHTLN